MAAPSDLPLPLLYATKNVAAEIVPWRLGGVERITVVAKIAFALAPGELQDLWPEVEIVTRDRHLQKSPARSIEAPGDLAPFLPRAEVLAFGHAYGPSGRATPTLSAQIQIARGTQSVLRKHVVVVGDRSSSDEHPAHFQRMPLVWERAARSTSNPVGVDPAARTPNFVDASDPLRAAGFGAVAPGWAQRRARLGDVPLGVVDAPVMDLPQGFDFAYFNAAPEDQWFDRLFGDEWIALDGLHPVLPRLQLKLPGYSFAARVVDGGGRPRHMVGLVADRLVLDCDRQVGTLTYRTAIVAPWSDLAAQRIEVGVLRGEQTATFPNVRDPSTLRGRAPAPAAVAEAPQSYRALPFSPSAPGFVAPPPSAPGLVAPTSTPGFAAPPSAPGFVAPPSAPGFVAPPPRFPAAEPTVDEVSPPVSLPFVARADAYAPKAEPPAPKTSPAAAPAPTTAPAPDRTLLQDHIPTLSDVGLAVVAFPWQMRALQETLVVVVKGTFDLVERGPAKLREESDFPIGDVFQEDNVEKALVSASDFAILKPEVDVLVQGHAYAPGGKATAMQAAIRMKTGQGLFERSVAVFGDRTWQSGGLPSTPAAFDKIPLSYARAFGGPDFAVNPVGIGHKGAAGADGVKRLPNIEASGKLIRSPADTPAPAGLGAIHPFSKTRWDLVGTYDKTWFKTRWPYYPTDFDYRYFQAAPPGQRLPKVTGDEEYELTGVHPKQGSFAGKLPGLRARLFAERTKAAGGGFVEVPIKIDTITFSPDEGAVHVVWRGQLDVADEDARELARLFATVEPLAGPQLTLAEARARCLIAAAEPEPEPEAEAEREPVDTTESDREAEEERKEEEAIMAKLADLGLTPANDSEEAAAIAALPPPDPELVAKVLREAGGSEEDIAEVQAALRGEESEPLANPTDLRELVKGRIARGELLDGLDLRGADLSDLDLSRQSLVDSDLTGAKLLRADLSATDATGVRFAEADFEGARLEGSILAGADFEGANLTRASLKGAVLDGAEARGAKFREADLEGAMLAETLLQGADLTGASLENASLPDADLTGATLDEATFKGASMKSVRLYEAKGKKVSFDRAQMTNARADGAAITDSSFRDAIADDSSWEAADLSTTSFQGASLKMAGFQKAKCAGTTFSEADLRSSRFMKGKLRGARFLRANMMEANCDRADFTQADLRGANLHGASLDRAVIVEAKLEGAIVTYTTLEKPLW